MRAQRSSFLTASVVYLVVSLLGATNAAAESAFNVGGSAQYFNLFIAWNDMYSKQQPEMKFGFKDLNRKEAFESLRDAKVDVVLVERPVDANPNLIQAPIALSAIAVIYNLPGFKGPLKLKPEVLYGLLSGSIKTWNNEKILESNPALRGVSEAVLPAFYIQPFGLTDVMSSYLMKFAPPKPGAKNQLSIRSGVGVNNSGGMVDFVKQNPGSIGFIDLQQLQTNKPSVATIFNQAKQWSVLETDSIQKASSQIARVLNGDFRTIVVNPPGLSSYPLTFLVYAVVPKSLALDRRKQLGQFIRWGLNSGDPSLKKLGLPTFPLLVKESLDRYMGRAFSGPASK